MRVFFQDPATTLMEGIVDLHNEVFFYLIIVVVLVSWMLVQITREYGLQVQLGRASVERTLVSRRNALSTQGIIHGKVIEIVWTILPSLVLVAIAIPTFALMYTMDELVEPALTLKVTGFQWYWNYEYSDLGMPIAFDSNMVPAEELREGGLRLLETDIPLRLPIETHVRVLVTAADVLHCWAVPSLGVKIDAVPGRLNQVPVFIKRPGVFYGQCSEICGVQHGFMPITVEAVELPYFWLWVKAFWEASE